MCATVGDLVARLAAARPALATRAARLLGARRWPREHGRGPGARPGRSSRCCRPSPVDDGRMPRVDDQPTDVSREAAPAVEPDGAGPSPRRPSRRRHGPGSARDLRPPQAPVASRRCATVRPPAWPSAATVVLAALLVLALLADPVLLAAGLAWAGIVVAWGWPALHGSSSRFGSSLAIGVTGGAGARRRGRDHRRAVPAPACPSRWSSASRSCSATRWCVATAGRGSPSPIAHDLARASRSSRSAPPGCRCRATTARARSRVVGFVAHRRVGPGRPGRRLRQGAAVDAAARDAARRRRRGRRRGRPRRRPTAGRPPSSASSAPRSPTPPAGCSASCRPSPRCAASCRPPRQPCSCPAWWRTASRWPSSAERSDVGPTRGGPSATACKAQ